MADLLNVDEAIQRILAQVAPLDVERVRTAEALGRALAEPIIAAEDLPPFANSSVDGYAVRSEDIQAAGPEHPAALAVVMDIRAGMAPQRALGPGEAARIMTGAPVPDGADAVVPVEQTDDEWESDGTAGLPATVRIYRRLEPGSNRRLAGEDMRAGQTVLRAGAVLRPQDIGVLVSLGRVEVPVFRRPRVAILSTGDELVDIDQPLAPGKIRNSNSYVLAGLVTTCGGIALRLPIARDTVEEVRGRFLDALAQAPDLVVSSAGVSVGTHDVVRTVIDELGRVDLWRVNLRPGKPLAFGQVRGVPFFGLPGNPVSAMVTFDVFVRPALLRQAGHARTAVPMTLAALGEEMRSDGRRSYVRVTLRREAGRLVAHSTGTQSSGALMSMVLADGLLIIPEGVTHLPAGSELPVRLLRELSALEPG